MTVSTILAHLKADVGLASVVGARIYRARIPQRPTYPLIMFRYEAQDELSLLGNDGVIHYELTFELYGKNTVTLDNLVLKLKAAMSSSSAFKSLCLSQADDDYIDDTENYSVFIDFSVWF